MAVNRLPSLATRADGALPDRGYMIIYLFYCTLGTEGKTVSRKISKLHSMEAFVSIAFRVKAKSVSIRIANKQGWMLRLYVMDDTKYIIGTCFDSHF